MVDNLRNLYDHLLENHYIDCIVGFNPEILSIFSRDVLRRIKEGDPPGKRWCRSRSWRRSSGAACSATPVRPCSPPDPAVRFHKYHALGNDYIVLDPADYPGWTAPTVDQIRVICHRNFGIGSFWCCVGTGMENHSNYGNSIYFHSGRDLYVNLFIASELDWTNQGLKIRQETKFPEDGTTRLMVSCHRPVEANI